MCLSLAAHGVQGAVLAGLSAVTSSAGRRGGRSLAGRMGYAAASGACVGAYLALEFVPGEPLLQVRLQAGCSTGTWVQDLCLGHGCRLQAAGCRLQRIALTLSCAVSRGGCSCQQT